MQGFNRYHPPDYDPRKHSTLNAYHNKHALGNRAKDIDKGILIVRFELPFNIWCGTCNAHLGAGVRYNARKQKVGNYYSTAIYAFRCKCHLCDGWFEIRTDPKNAAYVVEEGARKKDEDWNPEENGGFAIHDTEAPSAADAPADPFAHIEKTIDQQTWAKSKTTRLTDLADSSDRLSSDPYLVSSALRRKFREEKRVLLEKQTRDGDVRAKFGLGDDVDLGDEDVEGAEGRWIAGRERRGLPSGSRTTGTSMSALAGTPIASRNGKGRAGEASPGLAQIIRKNTARKYDPFASTVGTSISPAPLVSIGGGLKVRGKMKDSAIGGAIKGLKEPEKLIGAGLLAGYESD
ncbi:hypothetical protein P7C73_g1384, partial [Tremellales sp. Uapishka_1]